MTTFKCMGTIHEQSQQQTLENVVELLQQGQNAEVNLVPDQNTHTIQEQLLSSTSWTESGV